MDYEAAGTLLVAGATMPVLLGEEDVREIRPGTVVVDIDIDQGGSMAIARTTTLPGTVYIQHEVLHYSASNMAGVVPGTSFYALEDATLPCAREIVGRWLREAVRRNPIPARREKDVAGRVTLRPVVEAHGFEHKSLERILPIDCASEQLLGV